MISPNEIEAVSRQLTTHTSHVQRDYVQGWLLSQLYSSSPLGNQLVLKGGSCLRKGYSQDARYSHDLDFSTATRISESALARHLNKLCRTLGESTGITFDTDRTRVQQKRGADREKQVSEARLYFRDFFGQESELILGIRLDITQFDRLHLPVQARPLIHPYSDADACSTVIQCAKLEELLATKMRCLLQRRHIADLFDLVYTTTINQELDITVPELLSVFFKITVFGRSPAVVKGLFIDLPLDALDTAWSRFIACPKKSWFSFDTAKNNFRLLIDRLFPGQATRERSSILFPSSLRNPIMEAGQTLTLLRLGYAGIVRLVEPYSLVFKTRKDGIGREYFYAYDTTGGRSSGPGIKAFLPGKVEAIQNTDRSFKPRVPVELRKAGAAEIAGRFAGRLAFPSIMPISHSTREIQCPLCSRRFRRTTPNNKLRPHKDRYGTRCPGRRGYPV